MPLRFQNRPALVAYVTCGDPDLATTRDIILAAIDAGADVIELGVPFSDPVADGPVIQRASERALQTRNYPRAGAEPGRRNPQAVAGRPDHLFLSESDPAHGNGKILRSRRQDAGVDGALVTDLPVEESARLSAPRCTRTNLATVFLAAPTSTDERLKQIAQASSGFVYAVSRTGVTGARQQMPDDAQNAGAPPAQVSPSCRSPWASAFPRRSSSPQSENSPMRRWSAAQLSRPLNAIRAKKRRLWHNL